MGTGGAGEESVPARFPVSLVPCQGRVWRLAMRAFSPNPRDSCAGGIHPFLLRKKASPLGAGSTHGQPSSQLWLLFLGGSCGPRLHGALWAQGPVGRNHKPTALRASWEKGCPGVNGACVVVQARSQGTRGCEAPPSADVQDDLQGNFSTPSASLSPPEHLGEWAGRGDMGWCMCPSEGTRERGPFLPPTLWLPLRQSQCKWKAGFFPFLRRGWKALKRARILGIITQVGAERLSR